mmetsp:Transcript_42153/g.101509  ORF Transcript_42153/g.101509 Transcript_42153/m.101509 type:complete len:249 (-) Transcript_42153:162-908(-)
MITLRLSRTSFSVVWPRARRAMRSSAVTIILERCSASDGRVRSCNWARHMGSKWCGSCACSLNSSGPAEERTVSLVVASEVLKSDSKVTGTRSVSPGRIVAFRRQRGRTNPLNAHSHSSLVGLSLSHVPSRMPCTNTSKLPWLASTNACWVLICSSSEAGSSSSDVCRPAPLFLELALLTGCCPSPAQKRKFFSGTLISSVSSCAPDGSLKMSWPEPPSPCMRTSSSSVRLLRTKSQDRTCFCDVGLK